MSVFLRGLAVFTALIGSWASPAFAAPVAQELPVETYTMDSRLDGEPVRFVVQLYDARLLDQPALIDAIRGQPIDEIVILSEDSGPRREPSDLTDEQRRQQALESAGKPVANVSLPSGFFRKVGKYLRGSFGRLDRSDVEAVEANRSSIQMGIATAITSFGTISYLLYTSGHPISEVIVLGVTKAAITLFQNRYTRQIGHLHSRSWRSANPDVMGSKWGGVFSRAGWFAFLLGVYKWVELGGGFWTPSAQLDLLMLTGLYGFLDAWLNAELYEKYQKPDPKKPWKRIGDEKKILTVTIGSSAVASIAGTIEQVQTSWNWVLIDTHSYDFKVGGLVLMANFGVMIWRVKKNPEQLFKAFDWFKDFINPRNHLNRWATRRAAQCDWIYTEKALPPPGETAPNTPEIPGVDPLPQ